MPSVNEVNPEEEAQPAAGTVPHAADTGPARPPDALPGVGSDNATGLPVLPIIPLGDEDDDDDDDEDIDETLGERLVGLTEMFPDTLRHLTANVLTTSVDGTKWLYGVGRTAFWVVASSAAILALPVMFESERAQMEEQQMQQQRQILLGPNAAVSGMGPGGPPGLMPGTMPQVVPPPPPPQASR